MNNSSKKQHSSATIGLSRMLKITHRHQDKLEQLLANTVKTLEQYKKQFLDAAEKGDAEALGTLIHKSTMTIYYIEAEELDRLMQQTRTLAENRASREVLQESILETRTEFEKVIRELKRVDLEELLRQD